MFRIHWLHQLSQRWFPQRGTARHRRTRRVSAATRRCVKPRLEVLEDRTMLTVYTVTAGDATSLIADINAANAHGGANTIELYGPIVILAENAGTMASPPSDSFILNGVNNTTNGPTGLPVISAGDNLTIEGTGSTEFGPFTIARSTASGTPAFRLFDVASGASLTLQNLTLQGGLAQGSGAASEGGAVYNSGNLTLNSVSVTGNTAQGNNGGSGTSPGLPNKGAPGGAGGDGGDARGGGLYVAGGIVKLNNDTISDNNASGGTGGRGGFGGLGSTGFFGADGVGGAGGTGGKGGLGGQGGHGGFALGAGLYVAGGTVTLRNDTLSGNNASGGKGGNGGWGGTGGEGGPGGKGAPGLDFDDGGTGGTGGRGGPGGTGGTGGGGGSGSGGGVFVSVATAIVTLINDTISGNRAVGGAGGYAGVSFSGGQGGIGGLGGTGGEFGGTAGDGGAGGAGGAGGNGGTGGQGGSGLGGGINVGVDGISARGSVTLINDTISGNDASAGPGEIGGVNGGLGGKGGPGGLPGDYYDGGSPGAVGDSGPNGPSDNGISGPDGAGGLASGGGMWMNSSNISLSNNLIAGNTVTAGDGGTAGTTDGPDVSGTATIKSSDHDLIGNTSGSTGFSASDGDLLNVNPDLGPLQNNGGPTETMALLPGSPAIDTGNNTVGFFNYTSGINLVSSAFNWTTDERGYARIVGKAIDIGAYEYGATPSTADLSVTDSASGEAIVGGQLTFTLTVTNNSSTVQSNVTLIAPRV